MKSILLTTTAIVAFAGAAAADGHAGIGFAGEATLGYNSDEFGIGNDGFYWDASVDVTMTAALDNGIDATATFGLNAIDNDLGGETVVASDYVLSLTSETASMSFGDVDPVAEANWGGVDGSHLGFNDQDVHFSSTVGFESMLTGEVTMSGVTAMVSFGVDVDDATIEDTLDAMQIYVSGDFGQISAEMAYQAEFAGADAVIGVGASTSVAGADVGVAFLTQGDDSSIGIDVSYPVGPVTVGGYYSLNDSVEDAYGVSADYADGPIAVSAFYDFSGGATDADTDDSAEFGVEGSYDTGLGATILAGYITDLEAETNVSYIAGTYDLGGGAELLVSYAIDEDGSSDEIGDPEYQEGTTVEVSFSF